MSRAINLKTIVKKQHKMLSFSGIWRDSFGIPEANSTWIIWGNSGNGKSRFVMDLAGYISQFGKIAYNSLEEGYSSSFKKTILDSGQQNNKNIFAVRESLEEMTSRLQAKRAPKVVIIDSVQYASITKLDYVAFRKKNPNTLMIFISHADGKKPEGRTANFIRYDSGVKIYVEGYKAMVTSRYGGNEDYIIWQDGADKYWGTSSIKKSNNDY